MTELLNSNDGWELTSATYNSPDWTVELNGTSGYKPNGSMLYLPGISGDTLTAMVNYSKESYDWTGDVFFLVLLDSVVIYSQSLWTEDNYVPQTGTFQLEVTLPHSGNVLITTSTSSTEVHPFSGYDAVGVLSVTGHADPLPEAVKVTSPTLVYEFEKGWSFDGNYIPHFVELNWYFGDNPVDFRELSNVRVHGLTKGNVQLSVSTNGMETDSDFYAEDYSEPQIIDLPRKLDKHVTSEYIPVTNYEQPLNRGIAVQMKFEGRNEDLSKPEPSHVLQVLVTQSSPVGNGNRSN